MKYIKKYESQLQSEISEWEKIENRCSWGFDYFWDLLDKYSNDYENMYHSNRYDISVSLHGSSRNNELEGSMDWRKRNGFISVSTSTGGWGGGSCWNDDPSEPYETGNEVTYDDLKETIKHILQAILGKTKDYFSIGTIDDLLDILFKEPWNWGIHEDTTTDYEYYGNSTDTMYMKISLWDLYKFLSKYDAFF